MRAYVRARNSAFWRHAPRALALCRTPESVPRREERSSGIPHSEWRWRVASIRFRANALSAHLGTGALDQDHPNVEDSVPLALPPSSSRVVTVIVYVPAPA